MSKRGYINRYLLIIKKVKSKHCTPKELLQYLKEQLVYLQINDERLKMGLSIRTIQRDIVEIRNIFGITIEISEKMGGYHIVQGEMDYKNFQRRMEAFGMFNSLNLTQGLSTFIHLEKHRPQGTENFNELIHSIKDKLKIKFAYQKFWEEEPTEREVAPYALKECENRWYLLAKDCKDGHIKSFALDRLKDPISTVKQFTLPGDYNVEETYRYCYGIISPNSEKPKDIILSFYPDQGKYIKTLPLHETQEVLIDDEVELRIKLKLYVTLDFVMKVLSYGGNVKVLKPASLVKEIKEALNSAIKRYKI